MCAMKGNHHSLSREQNFSTGTFVLSTKVFKAGGQWASHHKTKQLRRSRLLSVPDETHPFIGNRMAHQVQSKLLIISDYFIKLDLENESSIGRC